MTTEATNPNPCPLCGGKVSGLATADMLGCRNSECAIGHIRFTPAEWAKLTECQAQRARADKAVEALSGVQFRAQAYYNNDDRREAIDVLDDIDAAVGKALEGLQ